MLLCSDDPPNMTAPFQTLYLRYCIMNVVLEKLCIGPCRCNTALQPLTLWCKDSQHTWNPRSSSSGYARIVAGSDDVATATASIGTLSAAL